MSKDFKCFPYGISDFKQVRRESKYLVDKTMYFERMKREKSLNGKKVKKSKATLFLNFCR